MSYFEGSHKLKNRNSKEARFRVDGNFFANLKATQVMIGMKASPEHFAKCGFNLLVREMDDNRVYLRAEERVILGWLEKKAVSKSLSLMLVNLAGQLSAESAW